MNLGPNQLKWIEALESGEYEQGQTCALRVQNRYCCLGVAEELFNTIYRVRVDNVVEYGNLYDNCSAYSTLKTRKLLKLTNEGMALAVKLNDNDCLSFPAIAEYIRYHPDEFFTQPA